MTATGKQRTGNSCRQLTADRFVGDGFGAKGIIDGENSE